MASTVALLTDWQHVELINLVRTHSSGSLQDVHLRVVFMNGVYRAQLNRTIGPKAEFTAAEAFHSQWPTVTNAIAPLTAFSNPSANAMAAVVAAHQAIVTILQNAFPNAGQATSFASKFLWPTPRTSSRSSTPVPVSTRASIDSTTPHPPARSTLQ
jgi:hypothetical protein